ncbi:hypothetical protein AQUCO_00200402v1 [Aquilegia coerulea]|uniref:BHLH domain-containing protein n=1 Tax=Aquilegia coerulea TaxID=218851 RepID=A0A2G5F2Z4_AQUCA|nr:hypothetical protein AQUCO_00200402v1 [Aquilegia coerulea]
MDPSSMINDANGSSYNLAEIWQFPLTNNGGVSESGGVLSGRRGHLGQNLAGFGDMGTGSRGNMSIDDSSVVTEYSGRNGDASGKKRRDATGSEDESSKLMSTSSGNDLNDVDGKRLKVSGLRNENGDSKAEFEASSDAGNKPAEQSNQPSEAPKQDYIHVRARRGQATDSHSLAERARREKISERMKILQDLVPGCNKVIGKAMVLDEIINYIQSLQRQVEFLSMKLEAVNSRMNPAIDGFSPKDFSAQPFDASGIPFGSQATREYGQGSAPEWLHMQVGGSFERTT